MMVVEPRPGPPASRPAASSTALRPPSRMPGMPKKLATSTGMVSTMVIDVNNLITMLRLLEMTEAKASIIPVKMSL